MATHDFTRPNPNRRTPDGVAEDKHDAPDTSFGNFTRRRVMTMTCNASIAATVALPFETYASENEITEKFDPALAAWRVWRPIEDEVNDQTKLRSDDELTLLLDRHSEASLRLARVVATTPRGLMCQLELGRSAFDLDGSAFWSDERDHHLYRSICTAVSKIAGAAW